MINKIKTLIYSVFSAMLALPITASAQFAPPIATGLPVNSVFEIISNVMYWILALVGIIGVIGFAIAGIMYLTAAGNEERIATAKNAMLYSIIGVIVALAGLVALQFASGLLNATI